MSWFQPFASGNMFHYSTTDIETEAKKIKAQREKVKAELKEVGRPIMQLSLDETVSTEELSVYVASRRPPSDLTFGLSHSTPDEEGFYD